MARVLVVEDDPAISRGLTALLKSAGHAAEWAQSGEIALRYCDAEPIGLLIVDIGLPGISGFQLIEKLRARGCKAPILVLTARDHVADRVRGLDLGADDYLLKPFNASELGARVRALLRREHGDPSPIITVGALVVDRVRATAEVGGRPLHLRPREWSVLACLSARAGDVVPKNTLLAEIFTYGDEVAPNALEVHVSRLRRQLEPDGPVIKTMRGLGYLLVAS